MLDGALFSLALALLAAVLFYGLRAWIRGPAQNILRQKAIEALWRERERIRATLEAGDIPYWECLQLRESLLTINAELEALGVPRASLR